MRLFLLTLTVMICFAANSVLNRMAVGVYQADPGVFAIVRVLSGAVVLLALARSRGGLPELRGPRRLVGAAALSVYLVGFSMAYLTLDAGLGALILFGVVQVAMFGHSALTGSRPGPAQMAGAGLAFCGLVVVLWPSGSHAPDPVGVALMVAAGAGWTIYTLAGRGESDALAATAANFLLAAPIVTLAVLAGGALPMPGPAAFALAALSGAVTSGMGYALWYSVLPRLAPGVAAPVQLSVPVIALAAGALLLGEALQWRFLIGAIVVLGGIALALRKPGGAA